MVDPNQAQVVGDWVCPCSGCSRAIAAERKELIKIITEMIDEAPDYVVTGLQIIEVIQDRMPKPRVKK